MNMPTVSLCVTAYEESTRGNCEWIRECLAPAIANPFINEIVVVNDGTRDFPILAEALCDVPKMRLVQNPSRLHVFGNKLESVWQATSEWVLMCDSDNIMDASYYLRLASLRPWLADTWYCASGAKPTFDYRAFIGRFKVKGLLEMLPRNPSMWWCFVNTGNQFVHRETFLSIFGKLRGKRFDLEQPDYFDVGDRSDEKWFLAYGAVDSFFMMKKWMLAGNAVHCVKALNYRHRIGTGERSNYERGPVEKENIPAAYFMELYNKAQDENHTYIMPKRRGAFSTLTRDDQVAVALEMATGKVRVS